MPTSLQEKLQSLIALGKSHLALKELSQQLKDTDEANTLILLNARWNSNQSAYNQGIKSNNDYSFEKNKINYSLLSVISDLEASRAFAEKPNSAQQKATEIITNIYNTYITGDVVHGDKVTGTGDVVHGDKVTGNQVTGNNNIVMSGISGSDIKIGDTNPNAKNPPAAPPLKRRILFISAEPEGKTKFNAGKEFKAIQDALNESSFQEKYELVADFASKPSNLPRLLLKYKPEIVHFSMHGSKMGVFFEDAMGNAVTIAPDLLGNYFEIVNDGERIINCVILSACHSTTHAKAIQPFVGSVIGMDGAILDAAARAYTQGFYQSLFEGDDFKRAHRFGILAVKQFANSIEYHEDKPLKDMPILFTF